jgi:hypothetical protein
LQVQGWTPPSVLEDVRANHERDVASLRALHATQLAALVAKCEGATQAQTAVMTEWLTRQQERQKAQAHHASQLLATEQQAHTATRAELASLQAQLLASQREVHAAHASFVRDKAQWETELAGFRAAAAESNKDLDSRHAQLAVELQQLQAEHARTLQQHSQVGCDYNQNSTVIRGICVQTMADLTAQHATALAQAAEAQAAAVSEQEKNGQAALEALQLTADTRFAAAAAQYAGELADLRNQLEVVVAKNIKKNTNPQN